MISARLERAWVSAFVFVNTVYQNKILWNFTVFQRFCVLAQQFTTEIVFCVCGLKRSRLSSFKFSWTQFTKTKFCEMSLFFTDFASLRGISQQKLCFAYAGRDLSTFRKYPSSFEFLWTQFTKTKFGEISPFYTVFAFLRSNSPQKLCSAYAERDLSTVGNDPRE